MEIMFLIGRIIFGGFFIYSGLNHFLKLEALAQYSAYKKVPAPKLATAGSGLLMLLGGLSILLGVLPVYGAWLIIIVLVPIAVMMHDYWNEKDAMARGNQQAHFLKTIALAGAALIISAIPATVENWGRYIVGPLTF